MKNTAACSLILFFSCISLDLFAKELPRVQLSPANSQYSLSTQSFEYEVLTDSSVKLGPVLFDLSRLRAESIEQDKELRITFRWPQAWLGDTELSLLDLSQQSFWQKSISTQSLNIDSRSRETQFENVFDLKDLPQLSSPFRFCVTTKSTDFSSQLCSQILVISKNRLRPARLAQENPSQVLINGRNVSRNGEVFLNLNDDELKFTMVNRSAQLNLRIRKTLIGLLDAQVLNDELLLTGDSVELLEQKTKPWKLKLNRDKSFFYFKTAGGIPLKQKAIWSNLANQDKHLPLTVTAKNFSLLRTIYVFKTCETCKIQETASGSMKALGSGLFEWSPTPGLQRLTLPVKIVNQDNSSTEYLVDFNEEKDWLQGFTFAWPLALGYDLRWLKSEYYNPELSLRRNQSSFLSGLSSTQLGFGINPSSERANSYYFGVSIDSLSRGDSSQTQFGGEARWLSQLTASLSRVSEIYSSAGVKLAMQNDTLSVPMQVHIGLLGKRVLSDRAQLEYKLSAVHSLSRVRSLSRWNTSPELSLKLTSSF